MANNWTLTWRASGTGMSNAAARIFTPDLPPLLEHYRRLTSITRRNGLYCKTGGASQSVTVQGYDELFDGETLLKTSSTGACRIYGSGPSASDYLITEFTGFTPAESRAVLDAWRAGTLCIRRTVWVTGATSPSHGAPYFRSGYYHDDISLSGTDSAYRPVLTLAAFSAADEERLYADVWNEPPFTFTLETAVADSSCWEDSSRLYRRLAVSCENLTTGEAAMEEAVLASNETSTAWTVTQDDIPFLRAGEGFSRGSRYRISFTLSVGTDADNLTEAAAVYAEIDVAAIPFHMSRRGNGVAFGKYSAAGDNDEQLFECAFPARFYENVQGVADYSAAAVPIVGTWLDGRRIHRVVIPFEAAAGTSEIAVIDDMDVPVRLDGSVAWENGYILPLSHYLGADNYHQAFFRGSTLIFLTASAAAGHIIVDYIKKEAG